MRVLIADDNPMWREMIAGHLTNWGHDPLVVENGDDAWSILSRDDAPRMVLLDWQMPGRDGIDVCRLVKRNPNHPFTYVLMLTSRDAQEDMVAGLDAGADDYLTKPIEPEVLRSRIAAAERIVKMVPPQDWALPRIPGYQVQRLLGKGFFATVWDAVREISGEPVALKIIRVDLATEEVFGRFAREIELMEKLNHPNIASIYDSQIDHSLGYYAMELMPGGTFENYVKQQRPKPALLLLMIAKVCDALDHAHQLGVIHRDLKPSNIMMTEELEPKLVDFGLARSMFRSSPEDSALQSMAGSIIGTPLFMAPEQARGEITQLDGRADIYALGIIAYVMLVRKHPHNIDHQDRWATIRAIADGEVRRPSKLRPGFDLDLEALLMKALARQPEHRYQTAGEFGNAIRRFLKARQQAKRNTGA